MENVCLGCKSTNLNQVLDLGNQPLANALRKDVNVKQNFHPLEIHFCNDCFLAQLNCIVPPEELFSHYLWVTGSSEEAITYSNTFCERVISRMKNKDRYILELASNDGTFLKPFIKSGYDVLGVDAAKNLVEQANNDGINSLAEFWSNETSSKIKEKSGYPDVIIARNVLAHVANLHDFILGITNCADNDTLIAIEFHYSGHILEELHYDSIYHEHLCYYTLESIINIFKIYNLYAFDVDKSPLNGGSCVIYLSKEETDKTQYLKELLEYEEQKKYNKLETWGNFGEYSIAHKDKFIKLINKYEGKRIVSYGASARSATLLNFCGIDNKYISMIADANKLKQGLYSNNNIPIKSPEEVLSTNPDVIIIMAWNFKNEIINTLKEKYNFKGIVILPLPNDPYEIDLR